MIVRRKREEGYILNMIYKIIICCGGRKPNHDCKAQEGGRDLGRIHIYGI